MAHAVEQIGLAGFNADAVAGVAVDKRHPRIRENPAECGDLGADDAPDHLMLDPRVAAFPSAFAAAPAWYGLGLGGAQLDAQSGLGSLKSLPLYSCVSRSTKMLFKRL